MTCEHFCELLPAYCEQRLTSRDMAFAREHLELCANCRADYEMWQKLASLPQEQPSPASRSRFENMLNAYEEGRWEKSGRGDRANWWTAWWRSAFAPPLASALAACLLLVGFIVGEHYSTTRPVSNPQIASMQAEVTTLRQLVAIAARAAVGQPALAGRELQHASGASRSGNFRG